MTTLSTTYFMTQQKIDNEFLFFRSFVMSIDADFQFRTVLLKIEDSLSNDDRMQLHFLFGKDIPRTLRETGSLEESIRVLQTLFERAKISAENVEYLRRGLEAIQRFDCVEKLQGKDRERIFLMSFSR